MSSSEKEEEEETYGPCRPTPTACFIGPVIPSALNIQKEVNKSGIDKIETSMESKEDDGEVIGPLPPSKSSAVEGEDVIRMMEERAERMRNKLLNPGSDERLVREDWMLKLPEVGKGRKMAYTVEKKTFNSSSSGPKDSRAEEISRRLWSETPEERERREERGEEIGGGGDMVIEERMKERDEGMKRFIEEHNKISNRHKSLLDSHREKLSKKRKKRKNSSCSSSSSSSSSSSQSNDDEDKKKKSKKHKKRKKSKKSSSKNSEKKSKKDSKKGAILAGRRPFDRDVDLSGKGVMAAKARNSIINNSKVLSSRFSHGHKSQFL